MTCSMCKYEFLYPCGCNYIAKCMCAKNEQVVQFIDIRNDELVAVPGLTFLAFLFMPLVLTFGISFVCVILAAEKMLDYGAFEDTTLLIIFIPGILITFDLALIFTPLLLPLGLLFGPPILIFMILHDYYRFRRQRVEDL